MPIFLKDEPVVDIGKLHVIETEGPYQIGRAFLFDGDTNPMIYSGEEVLYDYGTQNVAWTAAGTKPTRTTFDSEYMVAWTTSYETAGARTTDPIDLTPFSLLTFNFKDEGSGYAGGQFRIGVSTSKPTSVPVDTTDSYATFPCDSNKDVGVMQTLSVDVSSLSGEHYIIWDVRKANARAQVYKVWIE